MTFEVEVKVSLPGFHYWPGARPPVEHLGYRHRHLFVIRARKGVAGPDRDVEFLELRAEVIAAIARRYPRSNEHGIDFGTHSCEMIAHELVERVGLSYCSVHEDDENGAIVTP